MSADQQRAVLYDGDVLLGPHGALNPGQAAACVDRDRPLLLEASAGAGKTLVLVERFVRDVLEGDSDGELLECDQILAITFTRKAAAELRDRIRRRFAELAPQSERAREAVAALDGAWISTIDGFCARLLRRHALLVGVDPSFTVIDEIDLIGFRNRAFKAATERLLTGERSDSALDLFASDRYDKLQVEICSLFDRLRSAGHEAPRLPAADAQSDPQQWIALLDDLLVAYGEEFAALKRLAGGCDFADVVFAVRNLLRDNPAVADSYRQSFRRILIDEFQDTNKLQLELFDALGIQSRFQVGDPLQAIYGWRDADLQLFIDTAASYEKSGNKLRLSHNYRSRPQILELINAAFNEVHQISGIDWTEIVGGSKEDWDGSEPFTELLFTDADAWKGDELSGDRIEARLVASRIRRLIDSGEAGSGEVVILMESRTAMAVFREELKRLEIDAVSDGGDDWWQRIELLDLLAHLRLIANRSDDQQLLCALRSPICGISVDTLALIGAERLNPRVDSLAAAFENCSADDPEDGLAAQISESERAKLVAYRQLLDRWSAAAGQLPVGELLDRVVAESDYPALLLTADDGEQKLANVRQLLELASSWALRHGGDLRAFLAWVDEASGAASRETDAPVGGAIDTDGKPDPDGPVRLMTIHAAKGLQYPVVVVPRLGSGVKRDEAMIRVDGDEVSASLKAAGSDGEHGVIGRYAEMKEAAEQKAHFERRRKIHVAITRAERRLILSGKSKPLGPWKLEETKTGAGCLSWIVPGLLGTDAPELLQQPGEQLIEVEADGASGQLKLVVCTPDNSAELFEPPRRSGGEIEADSEAALPARPLTAAAAVAVPATISYSQLSRLKQCSYRWYLEHRVRLPQREDDGYSENSQGARARGVLAHLLLEGLKFEQPESLPDEAAITKLAATIEGAHCDKVAVADQLQMLDNFVASELWAELCGAKRIARESSFAIELVAGDNTLPVLTGTIDVLADFPSGKALVVDYKTDRIGVDDEPGMLVEQRYKLQRDAYALAALRRGAATVKVVYCFLAQPAEPIAASFTQADQARIEKRLREAAQVLTGADFPVSDKPNAGLCTGCPGRPTKGVPGLCSYSESETSQ